MSMSNQVQILKKTLEALSQERLVDPYKVERFRHQLQLAIIKESGND